MYIVSGNKNGKEGLCSYREAIVAFISVVSYFVFIMMGERRKTQGDRLEGIYAYSKSFF